MLRLQRKVEAAQTANDHPAQMTDSHTWSTLSPPIGPMITTQKTQHRDKNVQMNESALQKPRNGAIDTAELLHDFIQDLGRH